MLISADCSAPANNVTGSCAQISNGIGYIRVQPPQSAVQLNLGGTTYTFSHQFCVPFSIPGGKIGWLDAMTNGWKFWPSVIDEPPICSSVFQFQYKFCGDPVQMNPISGNNVAYPGSLEIYGNELKVPINTQRGLRFTLSAVTNCDNCICNACSTATFPSVSNWQFRSFQNYSADDVAYLSLGNSVFDIPTLQPISIFFNCTNSANNCP